MEKSPKAFRYSKLYYVVLSILLYILILTLLLQEFIEKTRIKEEKGRPGPLILLTIQGLLATLTVCLALTGSLVNDALTVLITIVVTTVYVVYVTCYILIASDKNGVRITIAGVGYITIVVAGFLHYELRHVDPKYLKSTPTILEPPL